MYLGKHLWLHQKEPAVVVDVAAVVVAVVVAVAVAAVVVALNVYCYWRQRSRR